MRIIHFSDSHLGYTAYRRLTPDGYNQRGEDIAQAFVQAVDRILELKPELVLHSGDLFDTPRPLNRMMALAYEQILRFKKAGIPFIIISGNHETPKQKGIGSVYTLLNVFEKAGSKQAGVVELEPGDIHAVYQGAYEKIIFKDVLIHAVPHCLDQEAFKQELQKIELSKDHKNIGMFHAGVAGLKEFREGDFNEQLIDQKYFTEKNFDYVALGHLHRMVEVTKQAWYSGSTERFSFNEAAQLKGFLEVELDPFKATPHYLKIRAMRDLEEINAQELNAEQVMDLMEERLKGQQPEEKIVRLKLKGIRPETYAALDFNRIRRLTAQATHYESIFEKSADERSPQMEGTLKGLAEEFKLFMSQQDNVKQLELIRNKGLELLQKAES